MALSDFWFRLFGPAGKKSRLDRALVNPKWWSTCDWNLRTSNMKRSNHKSLHLSLKNMNWGPVPLEVFNLWLQNEKLGRSLDKLLDEFTGDAQSTFI